MEAVATSSTELSVELWFSRSVGAAFLTTKMLEESTVLAVNQRCAASSFVKGVPKN